MPSLPPVVQDPARLRGAWTSKLLNLKLAWDEFQADQLILKSLPSKVILELTQNCNFKCVMCPQSWEERFRAYHSEYNMPMESFVSIADQLFPLATMVDLRGFGETTMLPYWPEVVSHLESFPLIEWNLVTNLSLPRADTWEKMIKLGFMLGFSCDGASAEVFESIRVRSKFSRILGNLEVIRDAIRRERRGGIYFISTITSKNVHELKAIVELAKRYDVPQVQFKFAHLPPADAPLSVSMHDREALQRHVADALDAALELGVSVTFNDHVFLKDQDPAKARRAADAGGGVLHGPFTKEPGIDPYQWDFDGASALRSKVWDSVRVSLNQRCFKPFSLIYVNYEGLVGTCNHMMYPEPRIMGNLDQESLAEIWNGAAYQDFRRQLLSAKPKDPRCQWCFQHRLED